MKLRRPAAVLMGFYALASAVGACQAQAPVEAGGACSLVSDCADGLVCIPQKGGTRICSANLGSIVDVPKGPTDGGTPVDGSADGPDGAGMADGGGDGGTVGPGDSGTPPVDSGPPPPQDAGSKADSGAPPADAGAIKDAASTD